MPKVVSVGCVGLWKHNSVLSEFWKNQGNRKVEQSGGIYVNDATCDTFTTLQSSGETFSPEIVTMSLICAPYVLHFGFCNIRVQFIVFSCRLMRVSSLKAGVVSSSLGAYILPHLISCLQAVFMQSRETQITMVK